MGWLSDVIGGIGDVVDNVFGSGDAPIDPSSVTDTTSLENGFDPNSLGSSPQDLTPSDQGNFDPTSGTSPGQDAGSVDSTGVNGTPGGGSFGAKALSAIGSAAIGATGGATSTPIRIQAVTPHFLNVPITTKTSPGKAQRAPTADPSAIYNMWESRLSQFVGKK